jgi:hypothetical protein
LLQLSGHRGKLWGSYRRHGTQNRVCPLAISCGYRRNPTTQPIWWAETQCAENNVHVTIGKEIYFLSGDGFLMSYKKDQPPPDLRYFNSRK